MQTPSSLLRRYAWLAVLAAILVAATFPVRGAGKRIVLLAGRPSHGPGQHEFRAGSMLLQKALAGFPGVTVEVYTMGWPTKVVDGKTVDDNTPLENADAILIYADGGRGNPAIQGDRIQVLDALAKKGVGLGFAHYGVEVPAGAPGAALQRWIGGYYETNWSVNPMWAPPIETLPSHPVTRGVKPFSTRDEWYFNMRWTPDPALKARITPILVATPSDEVRKGPYVNPRGPYDHIIADSGNAETMMWVMERPDGGRSLGFTGGHSHAHWGDPNQRRVMLNALLWLAKVEVPAAGVQDKITAADLAENLDDKRSRSASESASPQGAARERVPSAEEFLARWKDETNGKLVLGALWTASHSDVDENAGEVLERVHLHVEAIINGERPALEPGAIKAFKERLSGLLQHDQQGLRALAAILLGVCGDKSYTSRIADLLEPRPVTGVLPRFDRGRAAIALGLLGAKEYTVDLLNLLKSSNPFDRSGAAFGLGALRATEHEKAVAQLLNDEDQQVREAAKEGLAMMRVVPR